MPWSTWQALQPPIEFTGNSLAETLAGGQSFRWHELEIGTWLGQWASCIARVRLNARSQLEWSAPVKLHSQVKRELPGYFASSFDFAGACRKLPWRSDRALASTLRKCKGLRILRQPLDETLLTFICSSNKQIVQIRQICNLLAQRFGQRLFHDTFTLPSWSTLHATSESDLRACKAGYRARYIKQTAAFLETRPNYLIEIANISYPQAKQRLLLLPGVGEKIADCVLLFGAGKYEAFPVDVWITKCMNRLYSLDGWNPRQIAHFGRTHFGPYAGLAQQYLFAGERNRGQPVPRHFTTRKV